ncbi:MAG: emopamil-binding family protein [Nitrososphaerota archaeon]
MTPFILSILYFTSISIVTSLFERNYLLFWYIATLTAHVLDILYALNNRLVSKKSNKGFLHWFVTDIDYPPKKWWISFYEQYGRYDFRYISSDPLIISIGYLEIVEVVLNVSIIPLLIFQLDIAYYLQIILASFQIFGTLLYFIVPYVDGSSKFIFTNNLFEFVFIIVILNSIWIVVPSILLYDGVRHLLTHCEW